MKAHSVKSLKNAINTLRKMKNLSQKQLSQETGLRQPTISNFENKPEKAHLETLFKLLEAMDLELEIKPKNTESNDWNEEW